MQLDRLSKDAAALVAVFIEWLIDLISTMVNDFSVSNFNCQASDWKMFTKWHINSEMAYLHSGAGEDRAEEEVTQLEDRG